jgi:hypothetical protein
LRMVRGFSRDQALQRSLKGDSLGYGVVIGVLGSAFVQRGD